MKKIRALRRAMVMMSFITFPGFASLYPIPHSSLASLRDAHGTAIDLDGAAPSRASSRVDWFTYDRLILDPIDVYRGTDSQFVGVSEGEKTQLSQYMYRRFATTLAQRFALTTNAATGKTLRVHLVLAGAEVSPFLASAVTWLDYAGGLYNMTQAIFGGHSAYSGSVSYAVEIFDASNDHLLEAYVTRQYPGALDIAAIFRPLGAAKAGIDKGADALLAQIR
ncbi:DUF3313 domain-containing protein [Pararobbsia alpina]|uniref:DUF3313 domain-containing protein n=1 Tax=Pararobbsia alpina TaxID=621374 RepID=UPI0039A58644